MEEKPKRDMKKILAGKTPAQWLEDKGFIQYKELGWIKQDRVDHCIDKGYIKQSGGELLPTDLGMKTTALAYLRGDEDTITFVKSPQEKAKEKEESQKQPKTEVKRDKPRKVEAESIFKDMI